ncbi:MAG: hypothetical protein V4520_11110 [Bacteroidota bacterium]
MNEKTTGISLVIFTCEGREHLLQKTYESFKNHVDYTFDKVFIAVDGEVDLAAINYINADCIIQHVKRKGYVNSIKQALKFIETPYFFWLEDDWKFNSPIAVESYINTLTSNPNWAEIILSKFGPLNQEQKSVRLHDDLYNSIAGFSANPCFCNTTHLQNAFTELANATKGGVLGEDGFENFLTKHFLNLRIVCAIEDPVDHEPITHEGYLESTPRNWHMTNSLEIKTKEHLMTIPVPSFYNRIKMAVKLTFTFTRLFVKQFWINHVYEYCFRIVTSSKNID